ncbi:MAG: hypothetical protein KME35_09495 [Aphanocapsa sp. GSE-SYN-MK-11-07L]|nr:hypothetical protein [Aphanocapsa sp. GSE-SYN-MK-11-07L]
MNGNDCFHRLQAKGRGNASILALWVCLKALAMAYFAGGQRPSPNMFRQGMPGQNCLKGGCQLK